MTNEIDLRLLRAATVVAAELHITHASERLGITQPALTKQLKELEDRVGAVLFDRDTQNVELTDAGRAFMPDAERCLYHREQAIQAARLAAKGAEAQLKVGMSPYVDPFLSSLMMSLHLSRYPTLRIHTFSDTSPNLVRKVSTGELDVALVAASGDSKDLSSIELTRVPFYILLEKGSALATHKELTLDLLRESTWILFAQHVHPQLYDLIARRALDAGIAPREKHHVTTAEQAAQFVHSTGGVAFLTRAGAWRVTVDGLTVRPLSEPELYVRTVVTTHIEASRLVSEFIRTFVKKVEDPRTATQQTLFRTG
jgi:DNA-binding transcriptional LysR family regulator